MSDNPPPQPPSGPPPDEPMPENPTSRYQPYPGRGPYPGGQYSGGQQPGMQYPAMQYPGAGQPPAGPPGSPPPSGGIMGSGDEFRLRLARRPEPRFTTALAGIGMAMALFGTLLWGGTYWTQGLLESGPDTDRNLLGAGIAALLVLAGYGLAIMRRRGPLATAGAVAAGVGVPIVILFLTVDAQDSSGVNYDAVFWVSAVVWALSYALVPGMRGRTFFVGLFATQLLNYVIEKSSDNIVGGIFTGAGPQLPSRGTLAGIGLGFGLAYYALAYLLDHTGRHGPATGLVFPAYFATAAGIIAWSPDIHLLGAGLVTIAVSLLVCWYGARYGRRLTSFAAAAGATFGVGVLVYDAVHNDSVEAGVTFLLVGIAVVAIAALLAHAIGDPDDMTPGPVSGAR